MAYIQRDDSGRITGISDSANGSSDEHLDLENPEIQAYLELAKNQLSSSDTETIRVIEDLVELLVEKKLIMLTDLPEAAQQKITVRQRMRGDLGMLAGLIVDEEGIL